MSLKSRIALNLGIAFSLIFGVIMCLIYISFKDFRREEFKERFKKRLIYTVNFIEKSKDFEQEASFFFDENSDDALFNENIMIFNSEKNLIYSTLKDNKVTWDDHLLDRLDKEKSIYIACFNPETYAALRKINGKNYYIITSAYDITGESKKVFLKYMLILSYVISVLLIGFFSYYIVSRFLKPLEALKTDISEISAHKLIIPIVVKNKKDEIGVLATSFNLMTNRLNDVFQSQKDFNSSAAHEMRTPLTRMAFQLENLIQLEKHSDKTKSTLTQMLFDVYQLSDLTVSLLLLSKFDKEGITSVYEEVRIDEVIFDAFEKVERNFVHFKMDFQIHEEVSPEAMLIVNGVQSLLEITFVNLLKNAALYSEDQRVEISINETKFQLIVNIFSRGTIIPISEREKLFEAFMRGSNSKNKSGSGLGLRIVKRILEYHKANISYSSLSDNGNLFIVTFNK